MGGVKGEERETPTERNDDCFPHCGHASPLKSASGLNDGGSTQSQLNGSIGTRGACREKTFIIAIHRACKRTCLQALLVHICAGPTFQPFNHTYLYAMWPVPETWE